MTPGLLVDLAWKGTAVLLVACACVRVLRHSSAGARHLVWAAALGALLVMPLLVFLGPVWQLDVLPVAAEDAPVARAGDTPVARTFTVRSPHGTLVREPMPPRLPVARSFLPVARTFIPRLGSGHVVRETSQGSSNRMSLASVMVVVWAAGALFGLLRLAAGLAWAAWIRRRASVTVGRDWDGLLEDASSSLGFTRRVPIRITDRIGVPVTCGIVRPALLLPLAAADWPASRRRAVILHELAHITRRDCLIQAIGHAARSLHWFNPLASYALRRLRDEQERACDDRVLGAGLPAADYARHLCDVASAFRAMPSPEWATLAMARPSNLEGRVVAILDSQTPRHAPRRANRAAAALMAAAVLPLSARRLAAMTIPSLPPMSVASLTPFQIPDPPGMPLPVISVADARRPPATPSPAVITADNADNEMPFAPLPDFTGTWILDASRSGSPSSRDSDPSRAPQWGDVVVILQRDTRLFIESQRGESRTIAAFTLDDRDHRHIDQRAFVGGGVSLHGSDVKTAWDSGKLVTLTRPFSFWVADENEAPDAPNRSGIEFLSIRRLSPDRQEMTVERVNRHDWGWASTAVSRLPPTRV